MHSVLTYINRFLFFSQSILLCLILSSTLHANPSISRSFVSGERRNLFDDDIIVTAPDFKQKMDQRPEVFEYIPADQIEKKGDFNLGDILGNATGSAAPSSGGKGQNTGFFMQGLPAEQSLFLLDELVLNDPSSPARSTDVGTFVLPLGTRVELLSSGHGPEYGSEGLAGVVKMVLPAPLEEGSEWRGQISGFWPNGGSFQSMNQMGSKKFSLMLHGFTQNFNQHSAILKNGKKDSGDIDSVFSYGGLIRFVYRPRSQFKSKTLVYLQTSDAEIDGTQDDPNAQLRQKKYGLSQSFTYKFNHRWSLLIHSQVTASDREQDNPLDDENGSDFFQGEYFSFQTVNKLALQYSKKLIGGGKLGLKLGTSHKKEFSEFETNSSFFGGLTSTPKESFDQSTYSVFFSQTLNLDFADVSFGYRFEGLDSSEQKSLLHAGIQYKWWLSPSTQFYSKLNLSSNLRRPSLFQRFSSFGKQDLDAEKGIGFTPAVGFRYRDAFRLELSHFLLKLKDMIDYDVRSEKYNNIDFVVSEGYSLATVYQSNKLVGSLTYTRLDIKQIKPEERLLYRRPKHKVVFYADLELSRIVSIFGNIRSRSPTKDLDTNQFVDVDLDATNNVMLGLRVTWNSKLSTSLRVDNLSDQDQTDVFGYQRSGRNWQLSVSWR